LFNGNITNLIQLEGKDYVAFDLEWTNDGTGNRTVYAAAFVDNSGNQKVLHISDFGSSEAALTQAITDEILKYPVSMGWNTAGMDREGRGNRKLTGGVSAAA
jgi:hypothetical protein